jgi:hypothetical protein
LQDPTQPGGWGSAAILVEEAANFALTNLTDGNIALFCTDPQGIIHYMFQDPKKPGGWGEPTSLGVTAGIIAVTSNGDGGLELFYTSGDTTSQLYHQSLSQPDGLWLPAQVIGPAIYALAAARDADGNAVIAYAGLDHTLYTMLVVPGQQPTGQQPTILAGSSSAPTIYRGALALTSYASGGLALFYIGDSGKIYHYYQSSPVHRGHSRVLPRRPHVSPLLAWSMTR